MSHDKRTNFYCRVLRGAIKVQTWTHRSAREGTGSRLGPTPLDGVCSRARVRRKEVTE